MVSHGVLPAYVRAASGVDGINNIGYAIWSVLKTIAMFVLAGFTVRDILKELNDSSIRDIGGIVIKYAAAWAIIVFILKIFKWIDSLG